MNNGTKFSLNLFTFSKVIESSKHFSFTDIIHRTSAVSKTSVCRWHMKNLKMVSLTSKIGPILISPKLLLPILILLL